MIIWFVLTGEGEPESLRLTACTRFVENRILKKPLNIVLLPTIDG